MAVFNRKGINIMPQMLLIELYYTEPGILLSGLSLRHWRKSFLLQSKIWVIFKERPTPAEERRMSVDIWKVGTFAQALSLFLSGSSVWVTMAAVRALMDGLVFPLHQPDQKRGSHLRQPQSSRAL